MGELTIRYADDAYFYDVFNRLGNNHPTKLLTEKRLEVLKPLRKQLEMITLDNVDAYKQKGTPEQDYLYKEMKQLQRQLGTDISTRFIGELAIAAYNTNNELKGLQADTFGTRFYPETTLEMFSQTIGRIIEYPLIEAGVRTDYNFVTTPNAFFHYLNNQSGEVIINKEILDNLTTQIKNSPIAIISETKEQEVMASIKKASDVNLKQEKKNETIIGDLSEITQKAAPVPEVIKSQPLKELSPTQSESHSELYFTIKDPDKSIYKNNYHVIDDEDLVKLNNNADIVQNSARWYLDNLADSTIHYFYQKEGRVYDVSLRFEERHYMHLTGIFPIKRGQTAEKTLHDFADGKGDYDNILISNRDATFQKIKALPDMKAILQVNAFYFDNVEDIPKLRSLNMEQAIQSHDKDILLAYQSNGENLYPASLMEVTRQLKSQLDRSEHANTILGIYSERNGEITPLSINHRYVKDGGQEMLRLLQSKSYQNGSVEEANRESMIAKPPLSQKSHLKEGIQRQAKEAMDDLVVSSAENNKGFDYHKASAYELSQQAIQDIKAFTESPEDLKAYLDFMSRFPQLSPRNAALIQAQWPGANAVATFKQWQELGKALDLGDADVMASKRTYTNKRTGESKEVIDHHLSVKAGEKSQITLFRPVMVAMIPVLDDKGKQVINQKGNPKFKPLSQATPDEKALVKAQKLKVSHFQDVDAKGNRKFMTYKVFELSQTTLKPESYPKAMPNRHYDFNLDQVKTKEVLQGLQDYANYIKVSIATDGQNGQDKQLGNAKGAFYPLEQKIVLNPNNTQGETISTTIHELAHATLHNPQLTQEKQNDLPKPQKELEAEMTSYLVSKHFGLDTAEKAIPYMAKWTKQLKGLTDEDLSRSMTRVHQTVARMVKSVETYTQPYALKKSPTRPQAQLKKPSKGRNL